MRKHSDIPEITDKTRISIYTCSSGTGWRLVVGLHPFGKNGGTRGSLKEGEKKWVDGVDVAGCGRPHRRVPGPSAGREFLNYAIQILAKITSQGGDAFTYGLETRAALLNAMALATPGDMARAVDAHFSEAGREFVKEWRKRRHDAPSSEASPVMAEAPSTLHLGDCCP